MSEDPHVRARQLLQKSLVEGVTSADRTWLYAHLRQCDACSREAASTRELVGALRAVPVAVPRGLAWRTQMRVRLRAQQAAQAADSNLVLWVITAASWLLGVFSAPLVWRGFAWVGTHLNLPKPVLELGFVLWWAVPALIAVTAVIHQKGVSDGFTARTSDSRPPGGG
jgi:anti-sigma factor RsiW